jgi:hypothetical protein
VMTLAFGVVLAAGHVYGGRAAEAGNAVTGVEVEPEVADLEGDEFRDPEVARATMRRSRLSRAATGRARSMAITMRR